MYYISHFYMIQYLKLTYIINMLMYKIYNHNIQKGDQIIFMCFSIHLIFLFFLVVYWSYFMDALLISLRTLTRLLLTWKFFLLVEFLFLPSFTYSFFFRILEHLLQTRHFVLYILYLTFKIIQHFTGETYSQFAKLLFSVC